VFHKDLRLVLLHRDLSVHKRLSGFRTNSAVFHKEKQQAGLRRDSSGLHRETSVVFRRATELHKCLSVEVFHMVISAEFHKETEHHKDLSVVVFHREKQQAVLHKEKSFLPVVVAAAEFHREIVLHKCLFVEVFHKEKQQAVLHKHLSVEVFHMVISAEFHREIVHHKGLSVEVFHKEKQQAVLHKEKSFLPVVVAAAVEALHTHSSVVHKPLSEVHIEVSVVVAVPVEPVHKTLEEKNKVTGLVLLFWVCSEHLEQLELELL